MIFAAVKYSEKRTRELAEDIQRNREPAETISSLRKWDRKDFTPDDVVAEMPAITVFDIVTVKELGNRVDDDELVIGIIIGGKPRAYPINMLTGPQREILNDKLANRLIAATW